MRYILIILSIFLFSCTKVELIRADATVSSAHRTQLIADTSINSTWDGNWKVLKTVDEFGIVHQIHGKGTLTRWIIDGPYTGQFFDSSINFGQIRCYSGIFSAAWIGAKPSNVDNWWNIQKSMNICADNFPCYIPGGGTYNYSKTLEAGTLVNGKYQQSSLHLIGDASYWDNGKAGTTLQYNGKAGQAFNIQLNKGTEIEHLIFKGLWKSPSGNDTAYFNIKEADYKDVSGSNLTDNYSGITIDARQSGSSSGSTGVYIHEVSIEGFAQGLAMSQGDSYNDDNMTVDHLYFRDNLKYCIVSGQAQEKGMHFSNIYSWGSVFEIINIGHFGRQQAGNYSFDGVYIAGRCIQPFDVSVSHWYPQIFNNVFAESIARIGNFSSAGQTISIRNSTFDLKYATMIGRQIVISSNANQLEFDNCSLGYFDDLNTDIWVHGYMTFKPNCYFRGGKIIYK